MKEVKMSNYANLRDSAKDFQPFLKPTVAWSQLDEETKDAIRYCIKSKFTTEIDVSIEGMLENLIYNVENSDDPDYDFRVSYSFYVTNENLIDTTYNNQKRLIVLNAGATYQSMDFIVNEVRKVNKKLDLILKSISKNKGREAKWTDLNDSIIKQVLELYNDANVDIKTGKII